MVDHILCPDCGREGSNLKLGIIVICRLLPVAIIHYLDFRKVFWKIGGTSRMTLQANLLRKYLAYDARSLEAVDESKLLLALSRDVNDLVGDAFMKLPELASVIQRLMLTLLYQIFGSAVMGAQTEMTLTQLVMRFLPVFCLPGAMGLFLRARNKKTYFYLEKKKEAQDDMLHSIREMLTNFALIRDFRKRNIYIDKFIKKVQSYNRCDVDSSSLVVNNRKFASWCGLMLVALYMQVGGAFVVSGKSTLGEFLNNVAIYTALGDMWGEVYEVLLGMQNCFDALTSVVEYMNLPTETQHRMSQFTKNLEHCILEKADAAKSFEAVHGKDLIPHKHDPADDLVIAMRQLAFNYRSQGLLGSGLKSSTLKLPQGGLYTLIGPQSQGKGTVLKLMGEVLIPFHEGHDRNSGGGSGDLFIPTHLRVLHVTSEPMFLEGTLLYNLTFGAPAASVDRIVAIARKFDVKESLIETIKNDNLQADWLNLLSSTECAVMHTVRALIMNAEILCIHKPTLFMNSEMADIMYQVLKDFVVNRGLEEDLNRFWQRRPRTCIMTARRIDGVGAKVADAVFYVSSEDGMRLVDMPGLPEVPHAELRHLETNDWKQVSVNEKRQGSKE
jgi:ABC-type multidrug transport system fused ATPase/permease subunit